jgi:hypothetical protein
MLKGGGADTLMNVRRSELLLAETPRKREVDDNASGGCRFLK